MSIMSLVALAVSIMGVIIYGSLFCGSGLIWLFTVLSIASIALPPIAKKLRLAQGKKGKALEIVAIVIGGFNFYCVFFALTSLPILIGYLGWGICIVAYNMVKVPERQNILINSECAGDDPPAEKDTICFCRKCGEPLVDSSRFCRKCGTEIVKE